MKNKNFFDQTDNNWEDTIANIYREHVKECKLQLRHQAPLYSYSVECTNSSYDSIVRSYDPVGKIKYITFCVIDDPDVFYINKYPGNSAYGGFYEETMYEIKTKVKNIKINDSFLTDIFFTDPKIDKSKDFQLFCNPSKFTAITKPSYYITANNREYSKFPDSIAKLILTMSDFGINLKSLYFNFDYKLEHTPELERLIRVPNYIR